MTQHLRYFSLPFIAFLTALLWLVGKPVTWWQVSLILVGTAIWDFGWHARVHHADLWTARPLVRAGGVCIALAGIAFAIVV